MSKPINPDELTTIRDEYEEIRNRNGGDAIHNPDALAALALVKQLLDDADGWGESWVEDCVFFGGPDPDNAAYAVKDMGSDLDVRDIHQHADNAGLARREVRAYRWEVLDEPSDDEDEEA